jgi:basic amino acid/polyamine antiporter, APA family
LAPGGVDGHGRVLRRRHMSMPAGSQPRQTPKCAPGAWLRVPRRAAAAPATPPAGPEHDAEATDASGESPGGLRRELNLFGAVSMIVGIVIGSGIFLGVNRVAAGAGSPSLIALAWLLGGLLTLMGALTYAELGAMFPRAGGAYVFIRESLGRFPAFLLGWTAFTVNLAGSAAALAVIFAEQLNRLKPAGFGPLWPGAPDASIKATAAALILLVATINWFGLRLGGNVQKAFTVLKATLMVGLAAVCLFFAGEAATPDVGFLEEARIPGTATADGASLAGFFGLAMVAVFFAYDGWTNVVTVGSEIRNPSRNLPRAMLLGVLGVAALYMLVSFGYLNVLGFEGFATSQSTVASDAAGVVFGPSGEDIVATVILVSVLGSLNGITISGPRFYYAMARDGLFPRLFGDVNRHHVPGHSIWVQAGLAILFLLFLDFNALTDNVVFVSLFFYALAAVGLIVLRRRRPDLPRPYKVPLYPWVPVLYIASMALFVGYLLYQAVTDLEGVGYRVAGLAIVALGVPVYFFFERRRRRAATAVS